MAQKYAIGEKKVRPGVYYRISKNEGSSVAAALDGIVAFVMAANWGPVDKVVTCESAKSIRETFGSGAGVDAACEIFAATASTVYIKRLSGANGTAGTVGTTKVGSVLNLNALYPSERTFIVTVKEKAGDATIKQVETREGTSILETLEFAANETDETAAFISAIAESSYITAEKLTDGVITTGEYTLTGTNPTNTVADYADAFYALEPFNYITLAADSIDEDVIGAICSYKEEANTSGKLFIAVTGDTPETAFKTRCSKAAACNDEGIVFLGSSWEEGTDLLVGVPAVAYTAGVIAATPANKGIVHSKITGATDVPEKLTNAQYVEAIKNGLLLVSMGPEGQVWYDSGINTLITPNDLQDDGWKKIRRVRTRYELMNRIDRTLAPKIGNVNCDADGIAYIIQSATAVINEMVAEGKLSGGSFYEDTENPHAGDSSWFVIEVDDLDSLEKIYLHYQFRYSAN